MVPVIRRLFHPTILGDDVTRIVDLVQFPFREPLFLPFAEHVAPLFQLVSRATWEVIGHDVRLAPLGFLGGIGLVVGSGLGAPWTLALCETGSRTAVARCGCRAAQSPLVLETAWWYSASSFLWATAGILLAILGSTFVSRGAPCCDLAMVGSDRPWVWLALLWESWPHRWRSFVRRSSGHISSAQSDGRRGRRERGCLVPASLQGGGVSDFHTNPRSSLPHLDLAAALATRCPFQARCFGRLFLAFLPPG